MEIFMFVFVLSPMVMREINNYVDRKDIKGQWESPGVKALAFHKPNPGSVCSITYGPQSTTWSDPWARLGTAQLPSPTTDSNYLYIFLSWELWLRTFPLG